MTQDKRRNDILPLFKVHRAVVNGTKHKRVCDRSIADHTRGCALDKLELPRQYCTVCRHSNRRTRGYDKPFALTYLSTASFTVYLIPFCIIIQHRKQTVQPSTNSWWYKLGFRLPTPHDVSSRVGRSSNTDITPPKKLPRASSIDGRLPAVSIPIRTQKRSVQWNTETQALIENDPLSTDLGRLVSQTPVLVDASELPSLSIFETACLAMEFSVIWFIANWTFVAALAFTSVASGTTLGSTSGLFTLILGSLCGIDTFSFWKLFAVVLSFTGVTLVTFVDHDKSNTPMSLSKPLWGDVLALVSALCYAGYVTFLKLRIGSEDRISMPLFLGCVGAFNLVAFWPVGLLLHFAGIELLSWPNDGLTMAGLFFNMCITVVSDFAYLVAILKSSPLLTTIGLSLTIPMAVCVDAIQNAMSLPLQSIIGSILVLVRIAILRETD